MSQTIGHRFDRKNRLRIIYETEQEPAGGNTFPDETKIL